MFIVRECYDIYIGVKFATCRLEFGYCVAGIMQHSGIKAILCPSPNFITDGR